ncbi:hypothetical protein FDUTEX481_07046 [Tolypothrix sp. PCC 7601]|nr:hypothetical protein FDUTEX481_07046 [Tolypothrix sp. PCC 7601]
MDSRLDLIQNPKSKIQNCLGNLYFLTYFVLQFQTLTTMQREYLI